MRAYWISWLDTTSTRSRRSCGATFSLSTPIPARQLRPRTNPTPGKKLRARSKGFALSQALRREARERLRSIREMPGRLEAPEKPGHSNDRSVVNGGPYHVLSLHFAACILRFQFSI